MEALALGAMEDLRRSWGWLEKSGVSLGEDSTGEPVVEVELVVRGDERSMFEDGARLAAASRSVREHLWTAGVDRWVSVHFVSADELSPEDGSRSAA